MMNKKRPANTQCYLADDMAPNTFERFFDAQALMHLLDLSPMCYFVFSLEENYPLKFLLKGEIGITGRPIDDVVKEGSLRELIHPDDLALVHDAIDVCSAQGSAVVEYRVREQHGTYVWIRNHMLSACEKTGEVGYIFGLVIDVHNEVSMKAALRETEARLNDFAHAASDWMWEMDASLRYTWFSRDTQHVLGVPASWFLGKTQDEVAGVVGQNFIDARASVFERREAYKDFIYTFEINGEDRWVRSSARPVFDEEGAFKGYRGTSTNITEEVLSQRQMNKVQAELLDTMQRLREGVALWSPDDTLTFWNACYASQFTPYMDLYEGMPFAEFVEQYTQTPVWDEKFVGQSPDEYKSWRLAQHQRAPSEFVNKVGDLYYRIREVKTTDGGTLVISENVTKEHKVSGALKASQERYTHMSQQAPLAMVMLDTTLRITEWNKAAAEMFGYSVDAVLGEGFVDTLCAKHDEDHMRTLLQDLLESGTAQQVTTLNLTEDGLALYCDWHLSAYTGAGDSPQGIVCIGQNITQRREREEKLKQQALVFSQLYDGVIMSDKFACITEWNDGAKRIFGYDKDEVIGRRVSILFDAEDPEGWVQDIMRTIEEAGEWKGEYPYVTKAGEKGVCEASITPRFDEEGKVVGRISVVRDVTHRVEMEKQLQSARKMEYLGNLSSGIAHEFNNMLVPIVGLAEMTLKNLPATSPERKNLTAIVNAAQKASSLVRKLLTFGRTHVQEDDVIDVNVSHVARDALDLLQASLPVQIELKVRITPEPLIVRTQEEHIHQVLMNLGINARDAMDKGGELIVDVDAKLVDEDEKAKIRQKQVVMGNFDGSDYVRIRVKDCGQGMNHATLGRAFDPFFTTKKMREGSGMGMALVYGIVKQHGGCIVVNSKVGKGTTIDVYFPRICQEVANAVNLSTIKESAHEFNSARH